MCSDSVRSNAVVKALEEDGFRVKRRATRHGGTTATFGLHATNSAGKSLYYLAGDNYSMSYMLGSLAPAALNAMCSTYLERIVPSFISTSLDRRIQNDATLHWMKELLVQFANWITAVTVEQVSGSWEWYTARMPNAFAEMEALRRGAANRNAGRWSRRPAVTVERLVALNFSADVLMNIAAGRRAHISFTSFLKSTARERLLPSFQAFLHLHKPFCTLDDALWQGRPAACNSMAIKSPLGVVSFCRDFQLPNGGVFQSTACIIVRDSQGVPGGGQLEFYGGAPGFVGGVTGMRFDGRSFLTVAVNMLRAGLNVPCGIPASIVVAMALRSSATTPAECAVYISDLARSAAWIYPIASDSDAGALEAGGRIDVPQPLAIEIGLSGVASHVCSATLREKVPSAAFSCSFRNGAVFRGMDYKDPAWLQLVNAQLFATQGHGAADAQPLPAKGGRALFGTQRNASALQPQVGNNYFVPVRTQLGTLVTSNDAVTPLMRLFQMQCMATAEEMVSARCVQWRYDRAVDFAETIKMVNAPTRLQLEVVASFLSPLHFSAGEQYWRDETIPGEPLSALVEGCLNIVQGGVRTSNGNLVGCSFAHKSGLWSDPFAWVSCSRYLLQSV